MIEVIKLKWQTVLFENTVTVDILDSTWNKFFTSINETCTIIADEEEPHIYCASMNTFLNIFLTIFIQQFKLLVRTSEKPICDCAFCTFMYHLRKIWTWKIKMMRLVYPWIWYSNHCGQFHLFLRWDKIKTLSMKNKWIIQLSNEEV